jgi:hypothetical protein
MKSSSLSSDRVIDAVNRDFVPFLVDMTRDGFPAVPGLAAWRRAYLSDWKHRSGFATAVVLDARGQTPLATSGCGHLWEIESSLNFDPDRFLGFVVEGLDRARRHQAILSREDSEERSRSLRSLEGEILESLQARNECKAPGARRTSP